MKRTNYVVESRMEGAPSWSEGGTRERDQIEWTRKHGNVPIESVKEEVGYEVLDPSFPSLSIVRRA